jgi:hypothetical protein
LISAVALSVLASRPAFALCARVWTPITMVTVSGILVTVPRWLVSNGLCVVRFHALRLNQLMWAGWWGSVDGAIRVACLLVAGSAGGGGPDLAGVAV